MAAPAKLRVQFKPCGALADAGIEPFSLWLSDKTTADMLVSRVGARFGLDREAEVLFTDGEADIDTDEMMLQLQSAVAAGSFADCFLQEADVHAGLVTLGVDATQPISGRRAPSGKAGSMAGSEATTNKADTPEAVRVLKNRVWGSFFKMTEAVFLARARGDHTITPHGGCPAPHDWRQPADAGAPPTRRIPP